MFSNIRFVILTVVAVDIGQWLTITASLPAAKKLCAKPVNPGALAISEIPELHAFKITISESRDRPNTSSGVSNISSKEKLSKGVLGNDNNKPDPSYPGITPGETPCVENIKTSELSVVAERIFSLVAAAPDNIFTVFLVKYSAAALTSSKVSGRLSKGRFCMVCCLTNYRITEIFIP